ncbi:hypothetical protein [Modestobacter marinus]|uniref:hypothetical protein n=1 Tax=Modestobacter marinus TaxID=477641 RepID=UPI001C979F8D|nr:hypothetical protein [Modestobacter marinus]
MAREIPEAVRAVAGLAATVLDEARKLPETLPGLPVRLIGLAMQTSLRLQQQYSGLVARGDEVLTGLRGDAEPGLATFDEDLPEPAAPASVRTSAFDRAADPAVEEETEADALADALADDLAVADLPVADPGTLSGDVESAVLAITADDDTDLSPGEVAALPGDPAADAVTAVVDELAGAVADEVVEELPDAVPDEVLEDLVADVAEPAEFGTAVPDQTTVEEAVAGEPPAATDVPSLADVTPDTAPEDTATLEDATMDVAALDEAEEELVDLGGPDAAASVTPPSASDDGAAPGEGAEDDAAAAATRPPVAGYESFSIPALRGRLRAYPAETVADLLDYERATRARAPYVTLLQNRLEKLNADRGR